MNSNFDLLIKNGECVWHDQTPELLDIIIHDGKIVDIGHFQTRTAKKILDAKGLHILPGIIDTQVHFREPGFEYKEDLSTGSAAAILGGVTTIFEMPNTSPPTTSIIDFNDKLDRAKGRMWCDFAFFIGACRENLTQLAHLEKQKGCCGIKIFMGSSTGSLLIADDSSLEIALMNSKRRVALHCEDQELLEFNKSKLSLNSVFQHPQWRSPEVALLATQRILKLARKHNRLIHILHVSTKQELIELESYKDIATVECTPQHLTLSSPSCYEELGTYAQMNPPIREISHQEALWNALNKGIIDVIGSDHAPHTKAEKELPYPKSPAGMPGVQTLLPIMLNHMNLKRLSLQRLVQLTSYAPAQVYNIENKGQIKKGYDADLVLVDLSRETLINNSWIHSKCGWTPFHGKKVQGWPIITILRGEIMMRDGEIVGRPHGRPVFFK